MTQNELLGVDVSHHQGDINWKKASQKIDFAFIKATQGTKFVDVKFFYNVSECRFYKIPVGFYHFAQGGDPIAEADHFLAVIAPLQKGDLLALDFENDLISSPVEWCLKFLERVFEKTGVRPLLYSNEARISSYNWAPVASLNFGLWIAKYGINDGTLNSSPASDEWDFFAFHQFTSKGSIDGINGNVDLNIAYMSIEQLLKYGYNSVKVEVSESPKYVDVNVNELDLYKQAIQNIQTILNSLI